MSFCSFSRDAAIFDVTPVENEFLMEYMPAAPEAALRVYLYARMLCLHPEIGALEDMAKALRMDEDEVLDAFGYWEQRGLVEKLGDRPPRYELKSLRNVTPGGAIDLDFYKYAELHSALNELFGVDKLKNRHYEMAAEWLELWQYTQEAAVKIVEYERRLPGGRTEDPVFKRADKRAKEWAERGIRTAEDVERAIALEDQARAMANAVLEQLSIRREVTKNELECAMRWAGEWQLTMEDVLTACAQTTKSRAPSIAYLDAILKSQVERDSNGHFAAMKEVLRELNAPNPTPTPEQLNAYAGFLEKGFEPETIRLAAVQSARRNRNRFEDLEWMLGFWNDAGVRTRDEAEAYILNMQRRSDEMSELLKLAGAPRRPNMSDLGIYEQWVQSHSPELIRCAAEQARGAREPVKYMDKLLRSWAQAGVATPEAARSAGAVSANGGAAYPSRAGASRAQEYSQRAYTDEDLGKGIYYDLSDDDPEEGDKK